MPFSENTYVTLSDPVTDQFTLPANTTYFVIAGDNKAYPINNAAIVPAVKAKFPGHDIGVENQAWLNAQGVSVYMIQGLDTIDIVTTLFLGWGAKEAALASAATQVAKQHLVAATKALTTDRPGVPSNENQAVVQSHASAAADAAKTAAQHLDNADKATPVSEQHKQTLDVAKKYVQAAIVKTAEGVHKQDPGVLETASKHAAIGEKAAGDAANQAKKAHDSIPGRTEYSIWIVVMLLVILGAIAYYAMTK